MVMGPLWVVDSHTAGEPTRVVVDGLPPFRGQTIVEAREWLRSEHDWVRTSLIDEPRGSDVMIGAALFPAVDPACVAGVVFFNNVGYLGMCGHGVIGTVATLWHAGRIGPGAHRLETPVGVVSVWLHEDGRVTFENVPAYRLRAGVTVEVDGQQVTGDVAWGGNWFFLSGSHDQEIRWENRQQLAAFAWRVREALERAGVTGTDGATIDHVELYAPAADGKADMDNFVLCPGGAFDRSPCGTGASATVACLVAEGRLQPGDVWRQRGIAGGIFEATYRWEGQQVIPSVTGRAHINADVRVLFDPDDPLRFGIGRT